MSTYKIPDNEKESEELLEKLKEIKPEDLTKEDLRVLRDVLVTTIYPGLRDYIGILLVDAGYADVLPDLIKLIKQNIHTKYLSTLIYCCSYFDCSKHIQLFTDIIILKTDMSLADAMGVVNNMKDIDGEEKEYAINKLTLYLESFEMSDSKYEDTSIVIDFLKNQ